MTAPFETVLTTRVDLVDIPTAGRLIGDWARDGRGRMVCATNVHMVMESRDDPAFGAMVRGADLVVADGRPIVWACQLLGRHAVAQVRGWDLTEYLCDLARREHLNVGLYGGAPTALREARARLLRDYPGLNVTYASSPPFRPLTPEEDAFDIEAIRAAQVQLLFVGLGCPKQERWMAAHRDQLSCAMVGIGAVFDMLAGRQRVAPLWIQRAGLEWAFRLSQEPRRLWSRYARHNARFAACLWAQYARTWFGRPVRYDHVRRG